MTARLTSPAREVAFSSARQSDGAGTRSVVGRENSLNASTAVPTRWSLAVLTLVAVVHRLVALGRDGLWTDECETALFATGSLADLLAALDGAPQAPGYFVLQKAVVQILGDGEWQIRLVSAAAGIALVWLGYDTARRWISPEAALTAGWLLAISPIAVHYSREARAYALLALAFGLALRGAVALSTKPTFKRALAMGMLLAALLYLHNVGLFYLSATLIAAATLTAFHRPSRQLISSWLTALIVTASLYAPWLPHMLGQAGRMDVMYAWARPGFDAQLPWQPLLSLLALSHGALPPIRNAVTAVHSSAWPALLLMTLLAGAGCALSSRWRIPCASRFLAIALIVPLIAMLAASLLKTPFYVVGRVDGPAVFPLVLLVAAGSEALSRRRRWLIPVAFAGLALWPLSLELTTDFRSQERILAGRVARLVSGDAALVVTGPILSSVDYYLSRTGSNRILLAFPDARRAHPFWFDWSELDGPRLEDEIADMLARIDELAPAPEDIWLLLAPRQPQHAQLSRALAGHHEFVERVSLGYQDHELLHFRRRWPKSSGGGMVGPEEQRARLVSLSGRRCEGGRSRSIQKALDAVLPAPATLDEQPDLVSVASVGDAERVTSCGNRSGFLERHADWLPQPECFSS